MAAEVQADVLSHLTARLVQAGDVAHENFITMQKLVDTDYLHSKQTVTLAEALGAREVASKEVPAGPKTVQ